jgi:glycosyltransferase involved in cell wall biosynthesis
MNILWLSWKDNKHPQAGGAELVSTEIRKRLIKDGHSVRLITAKPENSLELETIDGVEIHRAGGRFSVYLKSFGLYRQKMTGWADLVIDEMNTIPFLGYRYEKSNTNSVLLTYQLAREVWFHQMIFPLSLIGYVFEPLYLKFISRKYRVTVTESESTRQDLVTHGFDPDSVKTFRVGMKIKPLDRLPSKPRLDTVLYLGAVRPMKQTLHVVKAFELARLERPDLKLSIVGDFSGKYGEKVFAYANKSRHSEAIKFHGRVSDDEKHNLVQSAGVIAITSVKEGWGLIATEAASQGVPAVGYATDGLRDSIIDGKTGLLVKPGDYRELAKKLVSMLANPKQSERMRQAGLDYSRQFTFDNSYADFVSCIGIKANNLSRD